VDGLDKSGHDDPAMIPASLDMRQLFDLEAYDHWLHTQKLTKTDQM
jgi:hypothetical protein